MTRDTNLAARTVGALLLATAAACDPSVGLHDDREPGIGDRDPNAPPDWPLAIGDPDLVEAGPLGGVRFMYDGWLGNCCVHKVNGVYYTAKFSPGVKNGKLYWFYEGHVKAEPQWDLLAGRYPEWISDEEWEDIKTYPDWEELMKPPERLYDLSRPIYDGLPALLPVRR